MRLFYMQTISLLILLLLKVSNVKCAKIWVPMTTSNGTLLNYDILVTTDSLVGPSAIAMENYDGQEYTNDDYDILDNGQLVENSDSKYDESAENLLDIIDGNLHIRKRGCPRCGCGSANEDSLLNGNLVNNNKYPWIVALTYNNRFFCSGSLINDRFVLTAAHCTKGFSKKFMKVHLKSIDRALKKGIVATVKKVYRKKSFNIKSLSDDISLLELTEKVSFSKDLKPICLPKKNEYLIGKRGIVSGWGATVQRGRPSTILQEFHVPIWSNRDCRKTVYGTAIKSSMLCAGYKKENRDSCQGDSGAPLMVANHKSRYVVAGVVSWGYGCAQAFEPGVYGRVTSYLEWIYERTKDACYCSQYI